MGVGVTLVGVDTAGEVVHLVTHHWAEDVPDPGILWFTDDDDVPAGLTACRRFERDHCEQRFFELDEETWDQPPVLLEHVPELAARLRACRLAAAVEDLEVVEWTQLTFVGVPSPHAPPRPPPKKAKARDRLAALPPPQLEILSMRRNMFGKGVHTLTEIAEALGLTREEVLAHERQALAAVGDLFE